MKSAVRPLPFDQLRAESFIRGETTLAVVCDQPFDEVGARLEESVSAHGLEVVHRHDLRGMLQAKGIAIGLHCLVYEVCCPRLAAQLIALDPSLAHALPCRISMHEQDSVTVVTTPMPTVMLTEYSHARDVAKLARQLEATLQRALCALRSYPFARPA